MRMRLTVNVANKIHVTLSQFSKTMVNVKNVVTILNLKTVTLNVRLKSSHAMAHVNGWLP